MTTKINPPNYSRSFDEEKEALLQYIEQHSRQTEREIRHVFRFIGIVVIISLIIFLK